MLKSFCNVDTLPSCNLYWLLRFDWIDEGNGLVNVTVLPVDTPENVADQVASVAVNRPIVVGSTFAVTLILQDGPASYPDKPNTLVTNNWLDCCKYDLAIYAASYFGIWVFTNFVGSVPPK